MDNLIKPQISEASSADARHGFAVLMNPAAPQIVPVTLLDLNTRDRRWE